MDIGKLAEKVEKVYDLLEDLVDKIPNEDLKDELLDILTDLDDLRDELLEQVELVDPELYPEDIIDVEKVDIYG